MRKNTYSLLPLKSPLINIYTITLLLFAQLSFGQTDLNTLLDLAERNYPTIAAKQAQAEAAKINEALEKNTLLPSLDLAYQANYATYNNITGMNYPASLIPISGPPSADNDFSGVFGSAASVLLKWSPFTFGQRELRMEYYQKLYEQQLAGVEDEKLRIRFQVALQYLDIMATQELIQVYEKNIERNETNLKQVSTLINSGIRPAVDSLQFQGVLSQSRSALYQLQHLLRSQRFSLIELIASEIGDTIFINNPVFQRLPLALPVTDSIQHPALQVAQINVDANRVRLDQIQRSWQPKVDIWSTIYARGSGVDFSGERDAADGLAFSRFNYGLGFQFAFPLLEKSNIRLKTQQQTAVLLSAEKGLEQTQLYLQKQQNIAQSNLFAALQIAREIPTEYTASEAAYNALQTRYRTGLIDYSNLIQAQYDLLNAEVRLKNAHLSAWKALLQLAIIRGDLTLFLNQLNN